MTNKTIDVTDVETDVLRQIAEVKREETYHYSDMAAQSLDAHEFRLAGAYAVACEEARGRWRELDNEIVRRAGMRQ